MACTLYTSQYSSKEIINNLSTLPSKNTNQYIDLGDIISNIKITH